MAFQSTIRVRFGDEDHAQIVYFPRFFDYFHQAFEDFFNEQGLPYKKVLDEDFVGWPAVHAEADFRSPLRFGDELVVTIWIERLGNKSATFAYRGDKKGGGHVVDGRVVSACIDMRTFQAQAIPAKYRALFEKHLDAPGA